MRTAIYNYSFPDNRLVTVSRREPMVIKTYHPRERRLFKLLAMLNNLIDENQAIAFVQKTGFVIYQNKES